MPDLQKTDSNNPGFITLVKLLDEELRCRYGQLQDFYGQFNKIDNLKNVIVAYVNDVPAGCGAIKQYDDNIAEVKRMLVKSDFRGQQIAARILEQLERWTVELGFDRCTLETGAGSKALCRFTKNAGIT